MTVFILEDDPFTGGAYQYHLSLNPDNEVSLFTSSESLLKAISSDVDILFVDYQLERETGKEVFLKIRKRFPNLAIVMVSGQLDVSVAVEVVQMGVMDYVSKDEDTHKKMWSLIEKVRSNDKAELNSSNQMPEANKAEGKSIQMSSPKNHYRISGKSKVIQDIYPLIDKACNYAITVSINGETGTGKEVLAKTIHENSDRADQSFVAVNMAAIPSELIESELFGHEKGSFTGAQDKRIGKFEEANKGTIFLDEIGDLDFQMQAKLLRVLQEKEVTRVGGNSSIQLDLRIITATHKNLLEEVHKGTFREDLYYRLLGISIQLPPLRERGNDVILLAEEFIAQFAKQNKVEVKSLSETAKAKLLSHGFPGNVRELKSLIELAMVLSDSSEIEAEDLQIRFTDLKTELLSKETTLKEYNEQIIQYYLDKYNHKVRLVADKLGISKSGIYRMLGQNNAQISA